MKIEFVAAKIEINRDLSIRLVFVPFVPLKIVNKLIK